MWGSRHIFRIMRFLGSRGSSPANYFCSFARCNAPPTRARYCGSFATMVRGVSRRKTATAHSHLTGSAQEPIRCPFARLVGSLFGSAIRQFVGRSTVVVAAILTAAHANVPRPVPEAFSEFEREWEESASNSTWSQFPLEKRQVLTTGRVYEQNPIKRFEMSEPLHAFENAITFLIETERKFAYFERQSALIISKSPAK